MPTRDVNNDWADWLGRQMRAVGLPTPTALARASGVDQSLISRWLNEGRTPTVETLRRLVEPLQTPLVELMVHAGLVTRAEARRKDAQNAARPTTNTDVLEAIRNDTRLADADREVLLAMALRLLSEPPPGEKRHA